MGGEALEWVRAAGDPAVAHELARIYADVQREIDSRGPACWASGRCCNFEKTGHRLYVTGVEVALTVRGIADANQAALQSNPSSSGGVALTRASLDDALARGGCPFQVGHLCGAHAHRPLGCRVFFCDRSAQQWQHDLCEDALARVKSLHDARSIPYRYGEWRAMLAEILGADVSS